MQWIISRSWCKWSFYCQAKSKWCPAVFPVQCRFIAHPAMHASISQTAAAAISHRTRQNAGVENIRSSRQGRKMQEFHQERPAYICFRFYVNGVFLLVSAVKQPHLPPEYLLPEYSSTSVSWRLRAGNEVNVIIGEQCRNRDASAGRNG